MTEETLKQDIADLEEVVRQADTAYHEAREWYIAKKVELLEMKDELKKKQNEF